MTDPMNKELIYKKWPKEESFNHLMLQYDLSSYSIGITNIPARIIQWIGNTSTHQMWNEDNTTIEIIFTGSIIFEGIRHCNFAESYNGYMNYPHLKDLSLCLLRIHELCIKYSPEYL